MRHDIKLDELQRIACWNGNPDLTESESGLRRQEPPPCSQDPADPQEEVREEDERGRQRRSVVVLLHQVVLLHLPDGVWFLVNVLEGVAAKNDRIVGVNGRNNGCALVLGKVQRLSPPKIKVKKCMGVLFRRTMLQGLKAPWLSHQELAHAY